ncbi:MAG: YcxB family protein [Lachnospiraceae bacterium]|nr:YcxB family protein [Lachnospiraceae bacterium]
MKEINFDVDLTTGELYRFSMRHTYCSASGIVGLFISLGSWGLCALRYRVLDRTAIMALIFTGFLFTVIQPVMLYSKAKAQKKRNEDINSALHYRLHETGISVSQGEQEVLVKWYEIRKRIKTGSALYLYMSPVRAFIFPKAQLGAEYEPACAMIEEYMEKFKDYEPAQEEEQNEQGDNE